MPYINLRFPASTRYLLPALTSFILLVASQAALAASDQIRLALVIGNSAYENPDEMLPGARKDADLVAKSLKDLRFKVTLEKNLTREKMVTAIRQFKKTLSAAGSDAIGFFYYAGHGGADSENTDNFLVPVDARVKDFAANGLSVRSMQNELQQLAIADAHPTVVVVIDACRSLAQTDGGHGAKQKSANRGKPEILEMTKMSEPAQGYLFAFSTSKNQDASDEGIFAQTLTKYIVQKGLTIPQIFEEVQREVYSKTKQFPIYQPNITAKICLVSCESDTKGAFRQNELLLAEAKNDADTSRKRISALDAANRCRKGWGTVEALYESAEKSRKNGNLDTAGATYEAVAERAIMIEAYLTTMNQVTSSTKRLHEQFNNIDSLHKNSQKNTYISPYRDNFKDILASLAGAEKVTRRTVDWTQLKQIEAQMEAFAKAENYLDATERAIEGYNVGLRTLETILGKHIGNPIQKEDVIRGFRTVREMRQRYEETVPDMSMLDNSPAGRACK